MSVTRTREVAPVVVVWCGWCQTEVERRVARPWNAGWFCADERACDRRLWVTQARMRENVWCAAVGAASQLGWLRVTGDGDQGRQPGVMTVTFLREVTHGVFHKIRVNVSRYDAEDALRAGIHRLLDVTDDQLDAVMDQVRWVDVDELPSTEASA